jgi:hypothetical protein
LVAGGELEKSPGTVREHHSLAGSHYDRRSAAFFE